MGKLVPAQAHTFSHRLEVFVNRKDWQGLLATNLGAQASAGHMLRSRLDFNRFFAVVGGFFLI